MSQPADRDMDAEEAAGFWDARLRAPDCSDADRTAHHKWKNADPANARAFETLQAMIRELPSIASTPEIQSMRAAALSRGCEQHSTGRGRINWLPIGAAIAASLAVVVVSSLLFLHPGLPGNGTQTATTPPAPVFATAVGERANVPLADGTTATLNTDSEINVRFSPGERAVHLVKGEAYFDVAHNPDRPFAVYVDDYKVTAVGTAFTVKAVGGAVDVIVTEGRVAVTRLHPDENGRIHSATMLAAGQQFVGRPAGLATRRKADLAKAAAWRDGHVVFDDTPLMLAAEEMNRYSEVKLRISDPDLARIRINGRFMTGKQDSFVEALETYFGAKAKRVSDTEILLEPAG